MNKDNIDIKKKYIYNSIKNNIIDHEIIIQYIIKNSIRYSKNNNGLFVNLSILNDNYVIELYNLIYNQINNKIYSERENLINNLNYNNVDKKIKNIVKPIKIEKKYKKINSLTDRQLDIINLSKTI
jgi:hypothetical protein